MQWFLSVRCNYWYSEADVDYSTLQLIDVIYNEIVMINTSTENHYKLTWWIFILKQDNIFWKCVYKQAWTPMYFSLEKWRFALCNVVNCCNKFKVFIKLAAISLLLYVLALLTQCK